MSTWMMVAPHGDLEINSSLSTSQEETAFQRHRYCMGSKADQPWHYLGW